MKTFKEYIKESIADYDFEKIDGRMRVYCKKELVGTSETKKFIDGFKAFINKKTGKSWVYDNRGTDSDDRMYLDFEKDNG